MVTGGRVPKENHFPVRIETPNVTKPRDPESLRVRPKGDRSLASKPDSDTSPVDASSSALRTFPLSAPFAVLLPSATSLLYCAQYVIL